ncbi:MAG: hypothetical protein QG652_734 [Pseudomonadota bacterium]|nr:hypothetical protein [Pseudomonadota bacterium]
MQDINETRRRILINALSAGLFAVGSMGLLRPVWAMGKIPAELLPGKSIYDLRGTVKINGKPATMETLINASALIETGADSHLIFAVNRDAFILRSSSTLQLVGRGMISEMTLLSGKLLSVFGKREVRQLLNIKTVTATIGIRGTGIYIEADPGQSYVCTCYGSSELASLADAKSRETVTTQHHDAPRYILGGEAAGNNIRVAPMINHTDDELALIEALVGREVPFAFSGSYSVPRKSGY